MNEFEAQRLAEALVGGLEELKRTTALEQPAGGTELDAQLAAAQAAVDAMKRVLGPLSDRLTPPEG